MQIKQTPILLLNLDKTKLFYANYIKKLIEIKLISKSNFKTHFALNSTTLA